MPNQILSLEWYDFARKNLETAKLLYRENHYTDVISIDIQQAVEKALKAVYAFNNDKIPRIHAIDVLFNYASKYINFEDFDLKSLFIISDYYQSERYPGPKYSMPERDEIIKSIDLAQRILVQVYNYIVDQRTGDQEQEQKDLGS